MRERAIDVASRVSVLAALVFSGCCAEKESKSAAGWKAAAMASPAKKVGVLDQADCQSIRGWAWDPRRPAEPVKVDVYDGDRLIATVTADQYRTDLDEVGLGDGGHEFEMAPPSALSDGVPHAIHARFAGTTYDLNFSPRTFICAEDEGEPIPPPSSDQAAKKDAPPAAP